MGGRMKKKIEVGDVFPTNEGGEVEVVEYLDSRNVRVRHMDKHNHVAVVDSGSLRNGRVKNPYHPSVFGKGYLGVGVWKASVGRKLTPEYVAWRSMLERSYCPKYQGRHTTYVGCHVIEEWLNFQVFAEWYSRQYREEGWNLDKDLIVKGNKIYGPSTATFVPQDVNKLLTAREADRGDLPVGVDKIQGRFRVSISIEGKQQHLGYYNTASEAFHAYKNAKEAQIKSRANFHKAHLDPRVYEALMAYEVNIDD